MIEEQLAQFRSTRRQLEGAVLPLATSLDGRRFTFQASLHALELQLGGYVVLEQDNTERLAQILSLELGRHEASVTGEAGGQTQITIRHASGEGTILDGDATPFHDALMRPATPEEVRAWHERIRPTRAALEIGEFSLAPGVGFALDAGGFDRHTFLCGQSGSGKTYSLGVILEQLLLETGLRIVILDPNSDYIRLSRSLAGGDPGTAERYGAATRDLVVHSGRAGEHERLRLKLAELSPASQAALLQLDPIADADEHAELTTLLAEGRTLSIEEMLTSPRPETRALAQRARNLGLERFGLWAYGEEGSVLDAVVDRTQRCVVVDLGSLATREEQALAAEAVLDRLWRNREARDPVLVVIDEAHNVCPAEPQDPLTALATQHAVRIAAEGRKFGLYLAVSTQRPQKVHENVISQCDNLMLMRLNSAADAAFLQAVFSFVPASLVDQSRTFGLGQALVAGKISPHPALIRFGARVAEEGGSDVPATWAQPRSNGDGAI